MNHSNPQKSHTKNTDTFLHIRSQHFFWINICTLFVAIVLLAASLWTQQNGGAGPQPFAGYGVNVPVSMGSAVMEVTNITTSNGQGVFTAPAGKHYLIVTLKVKNKSEKPITVLPSLDTYVKDIKGKVTHLTPDKLEDPFRAGQLLPGDIISGQLSYLVPVQSTQKLYIDAIWSGGVVTFAVQ